MSPQEVAAGLNPKYSRQEELQNRWMFCGDVSASTFDLLRTASVDDVDFELSVLQSSACGHYCVMTHQVQARQHRFLLPLWEPSVATGVRNLARTPHGFSLGRDNQSSAIVLPGVLPFENLRSLAPLCSDVDAATAKKLLGEFPFSIIAIGQVEAIPSLLRGLQVTEVNLSIAMPDLVWNSVLVTG